MKKFLLVLLFSLILVASSFAASKTYTKKSLVGGGTGALDAIDGDDLADGYRAIVVTENGVYTYLLNATSGEAEQAPLIIAPDSNAGNKRWILSNTLSGKTFCPNPGAYDQGITGNSDTLKYAIDTAGSDIVKILLRNTSANGTTTYTLTTDETIPSNVILVFDPGAVLGGAGTLTINGTIEAGNYQIFDNDLFVKSVGPIILNALWFGAVGDNSADNTDALQNAINAASYGSCSLEIPVGIFLYTRLYFQWDATDNPNYNTAYTRGITSSVDGAGRVHPSGFDVLDYDDDDYPGTVLRSTVTAGDAISIGIGSPYADRNQSGLRRISNITFLGETTGRIIYVGYSQSGFELERCFIGMKADIAGTALYINNAWGSRYKEVMIMSKTDAADVALGTTQSTGLYLNTLEEGSTPDEFLAGGNFIFDHIAANGFYTGGRLHNGSNVLLSTCSFSRNYNGLTITSGESYIIDNPYIEDNYHVGMNFSYGKSIHVRGGYMDLENATLAGIIIGNVELDFSMFNVEINGMYIINNNNNGAPAFKRYANSYDVTIKNNFIRVVDDPIFETSTCSTLTKYTGNNYAAADGSGWVYDFTTFVYNHGTTTSYAHTLDFRSDPGRNESSAVWDFEVDGGVTAEYSIGRIPGNATIVNAWYEVITEPTSDGASNLNAGVNIHDEEGMIANTAFDDAIFDPGYHDCLTDGTAANFTTKTTGGRGVIFEIKTAPLTAGKIYFWWEWIVSE